MNLLIKGSRVGLGIKEYMNWWISKWIRVLSNTMNLLIRVGLRINQSMDLWISEIWELTKTQWFINFYRF